jgi:2,5-dioxopentanoate dehydrogenase
VSQADVSKIELHGKSLIGWSVSAGSGAKFKAANPATGGTIEPEFISATPDEVNRAAELAGKAFPIYSALSAKERADFLRAIADGIDAILDQVVARMPLETALPEARVRNEAGRTTGQLRLFASVIEEGSWSAPRIDRADPNRKPQPKPDIRSMWRAIGPVAVFGASNFPLAFSVAGGDTASALAAGNPVIVKAHPAHPGTAELVGAVIQKVARELGMPEGVFSLLFDSGIEIGAALVKHPQIKAVGFTGSLRGGRALMDLAAARPEPIPVYAEMGSTNPIFILPGALKERGADIAASLHSSVTLGAGQFCTKPGLIFLSKGEHGRALAENLGARVAATAAPPLLTAQIKATYEKQLSNRAKNNDAVLLAQGTAPESTNGTHVRAAVFEVQAAEFNQRPQLSEEVFGPDTLLVHCGTREELFRAAHELHGHLTATVHGTEEDLKEYRELVDILATRAGRIIFNGYPTGVEVCHAMVHGGPYPATSDGRSTSVGTQAIYRFARLVCYQSFPEATLPAELQNANPLKVWRLIDGNLTRDAI